MLVAAWRVDLLERGSDDTDEDGSRATSQASEPLDEVVVSVLDSVEVSICLLGLSIVHLHTLGNGWYYNELNRSIPKLRLK
jgi:hypothetical protein